MTHTPQARNGQYVKLQDRPEHGLETRQIYFCQELVFPVSGEGTHAQTEPKLGLLFGDLTCVDLVGFVFALRLVYF